MNNRARCDYGLGIRIIVIAGVNEIRATDVRQTFRLLPRLIDRPASLEFFWDVKTAWGTSDSLIVTGTLERCRRFDCEGAH